MNLKEYYKALLNEAYAAKTRRRFGAFQKTSVTDVPAAYAAAYDDYSRAAAGRERSITSRGGHSLGRGLDVDPDEGLDLVRGAAVALASRPSGRARAEKEAKERFHHRGIAGGSPELRAAALAGKRPSGPNLRALIAKARQMYDGVEPI
jgi:hypothetical protein